MDYPSIVEYPGNQLNTGTGNLYMQFSTCRSVFTAIHGNLFSAVGITTPGNRWIPVNLTDISTYEM